MRTVRRHDHSPRLELMPLIDVVFLLLTSVQGGRQTAGDRVILVVLDTAGRVQIDGVVVADDELDAKLRAIAADPTAPPVVMTLEAGEAELDRGPLYQQLQGRAHRAGIRTILSPDLTGD